MTDPIVIHVEQEPAPDDDSGQVESLVEIARRVGALEAHITTLTESVQHLAEVDVMIAKEVVETQDQIEEVGEAIVEAIADITDQEDEVSDEVKDATQEIKATEVETGNGPTAADEGVSTTDTSEPPTPDPPPTADSAPGKQHWFFKPLR